MDCANRRFEENMECPRNSQNSSEWSLSETETVLLNSLINDFMVKESDKEWCKVCRQRNDLLSKREEILWQREDAMQVREKQLREDELMFEEKKRTSCFRKVLDSEELKSIQSSSTSQDLPERRIANVCQSGELDFLQSKQDKVHHVESDGNCYSRKYSFVDEERKIEAQKRLFEEKEKSLLVREEKMRIFENLIEIKLQDLMGKQKDLQEKLSLITRREQALNEANEIIILKEMALRNHEKILNMKESNILNHIFLFSSNSCQDGVQVNLGINPSIVKQPDDQMKIFQTARMESNEIQNKSSLEENVDSNQNQSSLEESINCYKDAEVLKSQKMCLDEVMKSESEVEEMKKNTERKNGNEILRETDQNKFDIDCEPVSEKETFVQLLNKAGRDCTLGTVFSVPHSLKNGVGGETSCGPKAVKDNDSNLDDMFFSHFEQSKEALRQNMLLEGKNSLSISADEDCHITEHTLDDSQFREQLQAFSQDLLYDNERKCENGENNIEINTNKDTDSIPLLKDSVAKQDMCSSGEKILCEILRIPEFVMTENGDFQTVVVPQSCSNRIISETNSISSSENLYVAMDDSIMELSNKSSQESLIKSTQDTKNEDTEDSEISPKGFFGENSLKYSQKGNIEDVSLPKFSTDMVTFNKEEMMDKSSEIYSAVGCYNPGKCTSKTDAIGKLIDYMNCDENGVSNLQLQIHDDKFPPQEPSLGCQTGKTELLDTSQEIDMNVLKSIDFHTRTTPILGSSENVYSRCSSVLSSASSSNSIQGSINKKIRKRPPRDALLKAIVSNQYLEIVKLVESKNILLEQLDDSGRSAFLLAVSKGNVDLVQRLRSLGANIWVCDYDGNSALHIAVANNDFGMLELLLKIGLNLNLTNNQGKSVLQLASDLKHFHLCKIMEKFVST